MLKNINNNQIDSLPPDYDCPLADNIRDAYQSVPAWTDHLEQNQDLQTRLDETLGTTGLSAWNTWCACTDRAFNLLIFG